jgi:hypothetical protein
LLLASGLAAAGSARWTANTADTKVALGVGDDQRLVIHDLSGPDGWNWTAAGSPCHSGCFPRSRMLSAMSAGRITGQATRAHIALARRLLMDSDLSAGQIALRSGFGHSENFFAVFKREVGMTPIAYRSMFRG